MPTRDTLHEPPTWPVCSVDDCIGIRINGEELCLAHLDSGGRAKFVASLKPKAELDLRGTNINADLVRDILKAVEVDPVGWRLLGTVNFRAAKFDGNIDFGQTTFDGEAWFDEAEFGDKTVFERTEFKSNASFYRVRFIGDVSFYRVDFSAPTRFNEARFDRKTEFFGVRFNGFAAFSRSQFRYTTWFHEAQFADTASFIESRFSGKAGFVRASFSGDALFHGTAFEDVINFGESRFQKEARFDGVMCNDALWFNKAQFGASPNIGPLLAANELVFDDATFNGPCIIEAATSRLSCIRARFEGPATLRIRWAEVVLDDCLFPEPSILTFAEEFRDQRALFGQDNKLFDETKFTTNATTPRPKLLSLRRADASNLTLLDVNLTRCLFESTYYLDRLQIAGVCDFPTTPIGWQFARLGGQGLPVWRWTFRRTIADEHKLRANRSIPVPGRSSRSGKSWHSPTPQWLAERTETRIQPSSPDTVAALFEALARALQSGNRPVAADFHYGALEMRRISQSTSLSDRAILSFSWLVSGHGMRASRAIMSLAIMVAVFALPFLYFGFEPPKPDVVLVDVSTSGSPIYRIERTNPEPFWSKVVDAVTYSAGTAALNPPDDRELTLAGRVLQVSLRILSSALLALAVASTIRSRFSSPMQQ